MYLIKFVVVIFVVSSLQLFCLYVEGSIHKINYYSCLHARLIGQHLTSTSDFYARSSYTISTVGSFTICGWKGVNPVFLLRIIHCIQSDYALKQLLRFHGYAQVAW